MSEYPSEWRECLLGEVVEKITSGGTPKADNPDLYGGSIPFLKIDDITSSSKYLRSHKITINERGLSESSAKIVPAGTLLLTMYGTIGRCCITTYPAATNQAIASFLGHPEIELEYLYYALESKADEFATASSQTTQANISAGILKQTPIAVPPLPEQKKIAEILSGIDTTIAAASKEKQHRDRLRRSAIKQLTRGASFTGQRKDSGTEFGMIPAHWECLLIPDCCAIENTKRKPIKKEERSKIRGIYPYHGATRIQDHISEYAYEGDYVLIGEDGDHFSKYDEWEMAQYATGRFNVSNHAHVIKGAHSCSNKWLYYSLLHRDLTYHLTRQGATRFKLSKASLECIHVIFPPPEEQAKMIRAFDSMTRSISILADRIIKLQALKTSLSTDLLSGRKRVSV